MPVATAGLERLLPTGTNVFVALLTDAPNLVAGTYTELADAQYARVAHSAWVISYSISDKVSRQNNGAIVFPAISDQAVTLTWWALFDAAPLGTGNMLAAGPLLNAGLHPEPQLVAISDQPRFVTGDLRVLSE